MRRFLLFASILFGCTFAHSAEVKPIGGLGLLLAEELETLLPSEQEAYILMLQRSFSEAEEADELDPVVSSSKKKSALSPFLKVIFGVDAVAASGNYCFFAGYILDDPPCEFPAAAQTQIRGSCNTNEILCNPYLFGENKCTPRNGKETRTCESKAASPEQIRAFIQKSPGHRAQYDLIVRLTEKHCSTDRQPRLCTIVRSRMYTLNKHLDGPYARSYGSTSAPGSERFVQSYQLPVFRPSQPSLPGCDAYDLMYTMYTGSNFSGSPILSLAQTKALVCGQGEPPSSQFIAGRESSIARAIASAPRGMRAELTSIRANLLSCAAVTKTKKVSTTLSPSSQKTSPNANQRVDVCTDNNVTYRSFARSRTVQRVSGKTGLRTVELRNNRPYVHVNTLGNILDDDQVDLCTINLRRCSAGGPASSAPNGRSW